MCVIIVKDNKKKINQDILKSSSRLNPDGLGVVWLDDYSVEYFKSYRYKVLNTTRPFIAHFRYATKGKVSLENTHPFVCGENCDELLMMNGTIPELGNDKVCDTKVLAEILGTLPRHTWKAELEKHICRFVTINIKRKTYEIYNRDMWIEHEDVLYSKGNVIQTNYVAVYGTLKLNNSNYYRYLNDSLFIGSGTTKDKYPLVIKGLPFLINEKGMGHNVCVDVFKVSDDTLMRLDLLEGHPNWYQRKKIPIQVDSHTISCWVYFNKREPYKNEFFHKTYTQPKAQYFTPLYTKPAPVMTASNDIIFNKECESCLEWFDTENENVEICDTCNKWLQEFYDGI